jgi:CheY-like chemotaxis protein
VTLDVEVNSLERLANGERRTRPDIEHGTLPTAAILYIEDNLANLTLVETILDDEPEITLIPALQGQLGLELACEHRPELILLDLHLPDIPGSEVLRRLRSNPATSRNPGRGDQRARDAGQRTAPHAGRRQCIPDQADRCGPVPNNRETLHQDPGGLTAYESNRCRAPDPCSRARLSCHALGQASRHLEALSQSEQPCSSGYRLSVLRKPRSTGSAFAAFLVRTVRTIERKIQRIMNIGPLGSGFDGVF